MSISEADLVDITARGEGKVSIRNCLTESIPCESFFFRMQLQFANVLVDKGAGPYGTVIVRMKSRLH